ncbi:bifunctional diguanylate cyclase/phosphodiesterase [Rhodoplanes roseus]|uniref:GGDEF-domain containing protein n=1 Tax=Rhodoplanes roseus TaxID=29409 RepID=A0A327KF49_9BRAD|nr:GGDEF-domain containing protein [Rhodoplanes roseus]
MSIGDVPYTWDIGSDRLAWGANAGDVLGITTDETIATGRGFAQILAGDNAETRFDAVMRSGTTDSGTGVPFAVQYAIVPPGRGEPLWVEDVGRWFAGSRGEPSRVHGIVRVINERRAREERLAYLSRYDDLTGEMNRWHMTEVLAATVDETVRYRGSSGFLLLAIDNVGRINEAYGYEVADDVIAAVAKRLRARMRGGDHLGRFSGNKFGIILKQCTPEDIRVAAERLLAGVRDGVVQTKAGPVAVTASVGGVTVPRHARSVHDALARSKEALEIAQSKRCGSFHGYQPNVERDALRRASVRTSDEIITALNDRRVRIAFEPVVRTDTRAPAFHECLMRIRRSDGGLISAGEVVPIAEKLGLIRLLDHRVLELVLEEMNRAPQLCASVNVSPASTSDADWWEALNAGLRGRPELARRLVIEITETAAIQDIDETRGFVARAKDLGCRVAIDDFGAGYTSFRNLRKLGVDIVKIDGAFVQNITRSEDDRAFVQTFLDLARRLRLETVAEWVQDEEAAALLASWGCDYLQGRLIGLARTEPPWPATPPCEAATR